MISSQSHNCTSFVHMFDIIFLFAAELEEPKIGISGKALKLQCKQILTSKYSIKQKQQINICCKDTKTKPNSRTNASQHSTDPVSESVEHNASKKACNEKSPKDLSLSKTTNFRLIIKLKEFADDNFKFDESGREISKWVENTGKKRNCKLLVTRDFSFSARPPPPPCFKTLVLQTRKNQDLFGNGLKYARRISSHPLPYILGFYDHLRGF